MGDALDILADAISDVGVWTWWQSESPEYMQVEFNGTELWNPPVSEDNPPSSKIALGFDGAVSVSFLTFDTEKVESNWPQLLSQDEIDYFPLDNESFTFTDTEVIAAILSQAVAIQVLHGMAPNTIDWAACPVKLGFRAGPVGLVIAAEEMTLLSFAGEFDLDEVPEKSEKWWEYWNEYWRVKGTSVALPYDYACEVTIPAGSEVGEDAD